MPIQNLNVGTAPDNATGEPLRQGGQKINTNFAFLDQKIDGLTKVMLIDTVPATGSTNILYAESSTTTLKVWNGTDYDSYGGGGSATVTYQSVVDALGYVPEKKRTKKVVTNTTQYTVIAADFTDFELHFTGDSAGADINVIINTGVCPDTEPSTGLQIVSEANHVLSYTGTATLTPQPGAETKTANDGSSVAITGIKPLGDANTLGVFGSLEGDGTGGGGTTYNIVSDSEDGIAPKVLIEPSATVSNITSTSFDATVTAEAGTKKKFIYENGLADWVDDVERRVNKIVLADSDYEVVASDINKMLYMDGGTLKIPDNILQEGDVIMGYVGTAANSEVEIISNDFIDSLPGYSLIQKPEGSTRTVKTAGVFRIQIVGGSGLAALSGDLIKDYEIFKSPNGTLYKVGVDDAGARTSTLL